MLNALISESPISNFQIRPVIDRWIRGVQKVFENPVRIEFKEIITELPDGPVAIVHAVYPAEGKPRETYTHWEDGELDTSCTHFLERGPTGEIVRLIPPEEEAVPREWKAALSQFELVRQRRLAPAASISLLKPVVAHIKSHP